MTDCVHCTLRGWDTLSVQRVDTVWGRDMAGGGQMFVEALSTLVPLVFQSVISPSWCILAAWLPIAKTKTEHFPQEFAECDVICKLFWITITAVSPCKVATVTGCAKPNCCNRSVGEAVHYVLIFSAPTFYMLDATCSCFAFVFEHCCFSVAVGGWRSTYILPQ